MAKFEGSKYDKDKGRSSATIKEGSKADLKRDRSEKAAMKAKAKKRK